MNSCSNIKPSAYIHHISLVSVVLYKSPKASAREQQYLVDEKNDRHLRDRG
ncbi:hypothetical protein JCM18904_1073 [Vibrio sp. JCM 18904]|nr:hypothetical protein JCM18904_1073 [Vibrio sp. JCM 18904]